MTSATDELRRQLDERGEKHYDCTEGTLWLKDGVGYRACAEDELNGLMHLSLWCTTPAQAVEATLGRGECHIRTYDNLNELGGDVWLECDACHWQMDYADAPSMPLNYCPNCGREVVE